MKRSIEFCFFASLSGRHLADLRGLKTGFAQIFVYQ